MEAPAPTVSTMPGGSLSITKEGTSQSSSRPDESGSYRVHAPGCIPLSPTRLVPTAVATPSPHAGVASPLGMAAHTSPPLPLANELPDDPEQASQLVHLYALPPLAPAWSPAPSAMARTGSHRVDESSARGVMPHSPSLSSTAYAELGLHRPLSSPRSPSHTLLSPHMRQRHLPRSPEPSIFERDIELCGSPHMRTPQEAIDTSVPTVLDEAADAILGDSALEVVAPRDQSHPPSPLASPDMRSRRRLGGGEPLLRGLSQDGLQRRPSRPCGHRRLRSEHSTVMTSLPGMPSSPSALSQGPSRRSTLLTPATPNSRADSLAPGMSPSVSIDGAIIPEGQAATQSHSLDGLTDVIVHPAAPISSALATSPVPIASPSPMESATSTHASMPTSTSYFSLPTSNDESRASSKFRYTLLDMPQPAATTPPTGMERSHSLLGARPSYANAAGRCPARRPRSADSPTSSPAPPPVVQVQGEASTTCTPGTGERKRLSWMAYSDLVREANEPMTDVSLMS
ncbi:hypothetical protein MEQU1_003157 [Malassezia equina]|uniref:Uncharacterized protein n=1 Tax=Malassezia equina TaxID=1381935 RepID=A0AAF0EH02_9BASI|nr:hypothetical protein MEQU1_003157 [Malassezia equina]